MKSHPKIAAILKRKNLYPPYRNAIEFADSCDKVSRGYRPNIVNRGQFIGVMHADLLKTGIEQVNGMDIDVWLMRALREYDSLPDKKP